MVLANQPSVKHSPSSSMRAIHITRVGNKILFWTIRMGSPFRTGWNTFFSPFLMGNIAHLNGIWASNPAQSQSMKTRCLIELFGYRADHLRVISGEPEWATKFPRWNACLRKSYLWQNTKNYRTALTSRNRVIQAILDKATKSDLSSWNTLLAEYAVQVIHERRKFFTWFQKQSLDHLDLPGPVKIELLETPLERRDKRTILKLLADYTERDLVVGRTTVGPHLDEIGFSVEINAGWQSTKYILSRGENKILLLAFIRLLGKYVEEISGKNHSFFSMMSSQNSTPIILRFSVISLKIQRRLWPHNQIT